jgi:hypothetical protein
MMQEWADCLDRAPALKKMDQANFAASIYLYRAALWP